MKAFTKEMTQMHDSLAAWLIAGSVELPSRVRDRQNLQALLEIRRARRLSFVDRLRGVSQRNRAEPDLAPCVA